MAGNLRLAQKEQFLLLRFDTCEQEYVSRLPNKGYCARHFTELGDLHLRLGSKSDNTPVVCHCFASN